MGKKITMTEVVSRDGLQIEPNFIETEYKISLIKRLMDAGVKRFEVTSFVHPKYVPQMSDAEEVMRGLRDRPDDVTFCTLALNEKGVERAISAGTDEINFTFSLSETHNGKNSRRSVSESLENIKSLVKRADEVNIPVNVGIATGFGCPFEGIYSPDRLIPVVTQLTDWGITSILLADTTGMAHPNQVKQTCQLIIEQFPGVRLQLHLHNTRGMGAANVVAGIEAGVTQFDSSLAGIGGCPFAPGASGNICTEDIVHMLHLMGYETNMNIDKLLLISRNLEEKLGKSLPGQLMKAGKSTDLHSKEWQAVTSK
ncbi:hydroxymethylglutaryl-CoA lyase [Psychrobacillus sp. OK032]|uniref:hydroxymethylglutaryl-CoA lyase n=1 Tax=Psychrobacillus sp. OK032 TaxID=1884358 RepID=UPI0008D0D3C6|nr:hydroxymethylglutaryl-CoA lyase [Psychrobacillus sp. OK032]SES00601.1 hydroxymethylglutaryl-CoA lyase [Psychrobacillus sp. OK032]